MPYDVVIIGAGIVGTLLARDLSRYRLKVAVLEKENDIADGATMANSAIVHTGYDPEEGTMKARMNVAGAQMYAQLCKDLGCLYKPVGAYIAATDEEEEKTLARLAERAEARHIPYVWLSGDQARAEEPNLSDAVTKVLSFPTTAVIYPWEVAIASMEVAVKNGVNLFLNAKVVKIDRNDTGFLVHSADGSVYETKTIVNAAGVYADVIAQMVCDHPSFSMKPKRGEYFVIDHSLHVTNHVIFPTPGKKGKGVLAVPTVYGNTLFGPSSEGVDDKDDLGNSATGMEYVRSKITRILRRVPLSASIRNFSGLRPSSTSADFIIEEQAGVPGFINCASIESPGLASAPAIAAYVHTTLLAPYLTYVENPQAVMTRMRPLVMKEISEAEKAEAIRKNPLYGKIICRCEEISEGEIRDCIHRPCGATTVKGVKKRVRPGMGRCQGGFCEPKVVSILADELHCSPLDVVLDGRQAYLLEKENR